MMMTIDNPLVGIIGRKKSKNKSINSLNKTRINRNNNNKRSNRNKTKNWLIISKK